MIIIDATYAADNIAERKLSSGTAVFLIEILKCIDKSDYADQFILLCTKKEEIVLNELFSNLKTLSLFQFPERFFGRYINKINLKMKQKYVDGLAVELVWFPFGTPYHFYKTKHYCISTIHDLIPVHDDLNNIFLKEGYKKICDESDIVVAISEFVKNDIINTLHVSDDRIKVIYNPVTVDVEDVEPIEEIKNKKYILDLNAFQKRKNADTLIKAYKNVENEISADLVFCGGYNEDNTLQYLKELTERLELSQKVHFYLSVPLKERNWLLSNAELLVSPSLSEGFGRTPIEAAIVGKKVIVTKADSLFEVTMGLLNYIEDPHSDDEIAKLLIRVYNEKNTYTKYQEIADSFVQRYLPLHVVTEYYKIMRLDIQ